MGASLYLSVMILMQIDPQTQTVLTAATGQAAATLLVRQRPVRQYQTNRLYDVWANGRHLIAKQFIRPDELTTAPACEFGALQRLAHLDVAPQPLFYDPALGPVVVYVFLEGQSWPRRPPTARQLEQLADLWLRIQDLPPDGLWPSRGQQPPTGELAAQFRAWVGNYAAWAAANFGPALPLAQLILDLLAQRQSLFDDLTHVPAPLRFCRADDRFANFIQRPDGRLAMVDWEDSGLRDPAREVADLLTHVDQEDVVDEAAWRPFLARYIPVQQAADPWFEARLHAYRAIFPLFWLAWLLNYGLQRAQSGQLAGWHINEMPANERLRRYLARALAWPQTDFSAPLSGLGESLFFPTEPRLGD